MWFEDVLAYDNARLPQSLIVTGISTGVPDYVDAGLRSLAWLMKVQTAPSGCFRPVGSDSFGHKRKPPEPFDQQPLEATATISACLAAWRADGNPEWRAGAARAFAWFLGNNDLSMPLADLETGSCRDGLHCDRPNENRGGEFHRILSSQPRGNPSACTHQWRSREPRTISGIARTNFLIPYSNQPSDYSHQPSRANGTAKTEGIVPKATFLNRQALYLRPDPARVVVRPFKPATEPRDLNPTDKTRANHIVDRVLGLDPETAHNQLAEVLENFQGRHRHLLRTFEARADEMEEAFSAHADFTKIQRQLIGAYFVHEYSFEASALFNPSIVAHPDQSGAPEGGCRFILSLRAVGEGHISSLTFRSGSIAADGSVSVDPSARLASTPKVRNRVSRPDGEEVEVVFEREEDISERVIFPVTAVPIERHRGCPLCRIRR